MTLQMHYEEKYEEGLERGKELGIGQGKEQEKRLFALRMLKGGKLPLEEIALYSGLSLEEVQEIEKERELQIVQGGNV